MIKINISSFYQIKKSSLKKDVIYFVKNRAPAGSATKVQSFKELLNQKSKTMKQTLQRNIIPVIIVLLGIIPTAYYLFTTFVQHLKIW